MGSLFFNWDWDSGPVVIMLWRRRGRLGFPGTLRIPLVQRPRIWGFWRVRTDEKLKALDEEEIGGER